MTASAKTAHTPSYMQELNPTPTPVEAGDGETIWTADNEMVAKCSSPEWQAKVVVAVNSHDALVAALTETEACLDRIPNLTQRTLLARDAPAPPSCSPRGSDAP